MSFDTKDIRRSMDVYTLDNVYLGIVVGLPASEKRGTSNGAAEPSRTGTTHGEQRGPVPTERFGNTGPATQGRANAYATATDEAQPFTGAALTVGQWWNPFGRRQIPLALVQTVSHERVVLRVRRDQLDR